jgi:hypothetical protein
METAIGSIRFSLMLSLELFLGFAHDVPSVIQQLLFEIFLVNGCSGVLQAGFVYEISLIHENYPNLYQHVGYHIALDLEFNSITCVYEPP